MSTRIFFLSRLAEGADAGEYERWVREIDLPVVRAIPTVIAYDVVRVDGPFRDGEVPYDYIEVIEVSDLDLYKRQLEEIPDRPAFLAAWRSLVGEVVSVRGTVVG
jgi:hypothetical protein